VIKVELWEFIATKERKEHKEKEEEVHTKTPRHKAELRLKRSDSEGGSRLIKVIKLALPEFLASEEDIEHKGREGSEEREAFGRRFVRWIRLEGSALTRSTASSSPASLGGSASRSTAFPN
jgi:hypothetical protein